MTSTEFEQNTIAKIDGKLVNIQTGKKRKINLLLKKDGFETNPHPTKVDIFEEIEKKYSNTNSKMTVKKEESNLESNSQ